MDRVEEGAERRARRVAANLFGDTEGLQNLRRGRQAHHRAGVMKTSSSSSLLLLLPTSPTSCGRQRCAIERISNHTYTLNTQAQM